MCFACVANDTRNVSLSGSSSFLLGINPNKVWSTHKSFVLPVADKILFYPVKETYVLANLLEKLQYR